MNVTTGRVQALRRIYPRLVLAFLLLVLVQVFLAGLGIWGGDWHSDFEAHRALGSVLIYLAVALFLLALVCRLPRKLLMMSFAIAVLVALESAWLHFGGRWVHAIHPTMTFVIMALGNSLVRASSQTLTQEARSHNLREATSA